MRPRARRKKRCARERQTGNDLRTGCWRRQREQEEDPVRWRRGGPAHPASARLLALAIRFEGLLQDETIRDYAELARLGRVTRARITQIMKLLHLAPDIQEQILFLPLIQGLNERPEVHRQPDRLVRAAAHVSEDHGGRLSS